MQPLNHLLSFHLSTAWISHPGQAGILVETFLFLRVSLYHTPFCNKKERELLTPQMWALARIIFSELYVIFPFYVVLTFHLLAVLPLSY